jgi:hypothetical protein
MNNFLDQLNLTAQERRVVVGIFLVVIVTLNMLFVWPHFGEWSRINKQRFEMLRTMDNFNRTIAQDLNSTNGWKKQVAALAKKQGGSVGEGLVDPQIQFERTIAEQERKTGVMVDNMNPGSVKTNAFFEEHSTTITAQSQEPQLVNFLWNMGNDPAMIRVAKLDLQPFDNNRYRLKGTITLTANYANKTAASVSGFAAAKPAPGVKPAAAPKPKPGAAQPPAQTAKHPPGGPPPGLGGNRRLPLAGSKTNAFAKPPPGLKPIPGKHTPGS